MESACVQCLLVSCVSSCTCNIASFIYPLPNENGCGKVENSYIKSS